ncbi:hypothetical protein OAN307_c27560 [Octadecabacter antarcticus 307]|uniref:Uncharacterized protein n=1 Tax=Octadecabacter antarcticus 307 TaxID=391626 RepID=M9R7X5_9RHOB|nr:hypothetical protein [Octadecabacter antarcticus]AGI68332.1 hypothetical protein OAN307_c27560 [Octadecabacter antarcticus 307]
MIRHLWQTHRLALMAFGIALCALGFFGVRTMSSMIYWMDPDHRDQALAGWMTPRYVMRSYQLPPDVLGPALFLVRDAAPRRISLDTIAAENGITMDDLQIRIDAAAAQMRADREARRDD